MINPLIVTIEHGSTREAAKERLARNLDRVRAEVAPYVGAIEHEWQGDDVTFRIAALGQSVSGGIAVDERVYRVTVELPAFLGFLGGHIGSLIRDRGSELLELDEPR